MPEAAEIWKTVLPVVREAVTGVGVWTALNQAKPVAYENGQFVLGVAHELGELSGHLRVANTKRLIELEVSKLTSEPVVLRIIDGITAADWETTKRKDEESRKLQEQAIKKMRAELESKASWETVYEQLSRRYAAMTQKSLPQNRARFYEEAVALVAEARISQDSWDDLAERNFARCLERVAQYAEVPAALVAVDVLKRASEL